MASKDNNKIVIGLVSIIIVLAGALIFTQASNSGILNRMFGQNVVTVPAGIKLNLSLQSSLSSGVNHSGDVITGTITNPIVIGEDIVIPSGSTAIGQVIGISPAERFDGGKGGSISIRFSSIQTPDGKKYPIQTSAIPFYAGGSSRLAMGVTKTVLGAATGAALGTALGAIAGGKRGVGRGAWSGAAIGGGIGATTALVAKGQEAYVSGGTQLIINLEQPVQIVAQKK